MAGLALWAFMRYQFKRKPFRTLVCFCVLLWLARARFGSSSGTGYPDISYLREVNTAREVWRQEVAWGHYPRTMSALADGDIQNRAIPRSSTSGTGSERIYITVDPPAHAPYPSRPPLHSMADLDRILLHCDFGTNKYVRDCLEVLRAGVGLEGPTPLRRGSLEEWRYLYVQDQDHGLSTTGQSAEEHVFHIFWTGPFTDKPYFTLLSFLFTQDLKLHLHPTQNSSYVPQIWVWIHEPQQTPGSRTDEQLHERLRTNPWSAPFLHQRFREVVRFRRWDTGEQLDALPELRGWRDLPRLHVTDERMVSKSRMVHDDHDTNSGPYGSRSQEAYDRASVALSDIARFVLCHRFGGVYLDADVILLRDWAELLRCPSAFAYRWSRLDAYNTAVLRLRRGSALGSFILRAARAQRLDLHPMAISRYLREAGLDLLLARLPDALFDPAWLNTEYLQRDRPPLPYFESFGDFFQPRPWDLPQAVGSVGFFRGAYAYHYHNYWWRPLDATRNWPDLGNRFGERDDETERTSDERAEEDQFIDLSWAAVLKRTFEAYIRGERPNMYGEWLR